MSSTRAPRDHNGRLSSMRRYPQDGWIAGVCAGVADYFGWSVKLIRVLVILAFVFSGFFPVGLVYLALWYLMDPAEAGATISTEASSSHCTGGVSSATAKARFERLERRLRTIESCVTQEELELRREFKNLET